MAEKEPAVEPLVREGSVATEDAGDSQRPAGVNGFSRESIPTGPDGFPYWGAFFRLSSAGREVRVRVQLSRDARSFEREKAKLIILFYPLSFITSLA